VSPGLHGSFGFIAKLFSTHHTFNSEFRDFNDLICLRKKVDEFAMDLINKTSDSCSNRNSELSNVETRLVFVAIVARTFNALKFVVYFV
jgi:hypothetical protein